MAVRLTFNTLLPMLYLSFCSIYLFHIIPSPCLSSRPFTGPQHIHKVIMAKLTDIHNKTNIYEWKQYGIIFYVYICHFISDPLVESLPIAQETGVQSQVVIPKTQKMVLDATLLNIQHYRVHIKGKVEQSREKSNALHYTLV